MFSGAFSWTHWIIVIAVFVLIFGANRLPEAARGLGQSMRIIKTELHDESASSTSDNQTSTRE